MYQNKNMTLEIFKKYYCIDYNFPEYILDIINKKTLSLLDKTLLHAIDATYDWYYKRIPNPIGGIKYPSGKTVKSLDSAIRKVALNVRKQNGVDIKYMIPKSITVEEFKNIKAIITRIFGVVSQYKYKHVMAFLKYYSENDCTYINELINPVKYIEYNGFKFKIVYSKNMYYIDKYVISTIMFKDVGKAHIYTIKDILHKNEYTFMVNVDHIFKNFTGMNTLADTIIAKGGLKLYPRNTDYSNKFYKLLIQKTIDISEYLYNHYRYEKLSQYGIRMMWYSLIMGMMNNRIENWKDSNYIKAIEILNQEYPSFLKRIISNYHLDNNVKQTVTMP